jgi:hypothetical protein
MYKRGGWIIKPKSCSKGLRSPPSSGAIGRMRSNGFEVKIKKSKNPSEIIARTDSI